jgi:hydroxymethylglutaryl-CoA lyase
MNQLQQINLIECPRDAMQGWPHSIATAEKVRYLNKLLQVGFHSLDFGSFVSPKAIPQMADTAQVIPQLQLNGSTTKLLAIVANQRGAEEAIVFDEISYLGFPFSVSPTFQHRNTNSTQVESLKRIDVIQELCVKTGKELVVYLSMGFGNPYGDVYNEEILLEWADRMVEKNISTLSLADTVGMATPQQISVALQTLIPQYPQTTIGVHLHATTHNWKSKLVAALEAGCFRVDGALKGIGGCPMAQDNLVGNMDTLQMIPVLNETASLPPLNTTALLEATALANEIFI